MSRQPSRRLFLKGAGVTLALPFLPSALWTRRAGAATCKPPRRFMAWFAPNGMVMPNWTPTTTGVGWTPPPILAPLAPIQNKIVVITGLDHQDIAVPPLQPANQTTPNVEGSACFLNMIPVFSTTPTRTSIDQFLLPVLNDADCGVPQLPTGLQIGLQGQDGLCGGTNCNFSREISWNSGAAMPNLYDPQQLFLQLFGSDPTSSSALSAALRRPSILDSVVGAAKSLSVTLSPADRLKLDEHTTLVRNLETRLQRLGLGSGKSPIGAACVVPDEPAAGLGPTLPTDGASSAVIQTNLPIVIDMMALAFACDLTRAITFMIGSAASNNDYAFLFGGVSTPHYATANAENDPGNLAKLTTIDTFIIAQAAGLLQRLDGIAEADGQSILDHTTFYLGSDIADGAAKNHWDMPVILAGGASGGLRIDGRHISYYTGQNALTFPRPLVGPRNPNQNTGQVFMSMLQAHGLPSATFGLATGGPLPELMP
jgi:hypothetical protein